MGAIFKVLLSILVSVCFLGGAVYLIVKSDQIPVSKARSVEPLALKVAKPVSPGRHDVSELIIGDSVPVRAIVRCTEDGKVTFSNVGCKDGVFVGVAHP